MSRNIRRGCAALTALTVFSWGQPAWADHTCSTVRSSAIDTANRTARELTATADAVAGATGRTAMASAMTTAGRTGVLSGIPCATLDTLTVPGSMPGLRRASALLSVADAAGAAATSGLPGLPQVVPAVHRVPGLTDVSKMVALPELPGVRTLPGLPRVPLAHGLAAWGSGGPAAGLPPVLGLPKAVSKIASKVASKPAGAKPTRTVSVPRVTPALPGKAGLPASRTTGGLTDLAEHLLSTRLIP